ncbi:MAG: hypothetical protein GWN59_00030 [Calditrichae bacterium]|nr:hypothetical protein [Calditrichia bacterium]
MNIKAKGENDGKKKIFNTQQYICTGNVIELHPDVGTGICGQHPSRRCLPAIPISG